VTRALALLVFCSLPAVAAAAQLSSIVPQRYRLSLQPNVARRRFSGAETIEARIDAPTRAITLDSVGLQIRAARVHAGDETLAAKITSAPARETITLTLPHAVAGDATVELEWSGALADDLEGLFATGHGGGRALFTHFEPFGARRVFPCFDAPDRKARFVLTVDVDEGDEAVSNTPIEARVALAGKRERVRFAETAPLPTYLVAVAAGPFGALHAGAGATPLRAIAPVGELPLARFALETAAALLPRFADYFGRPYPFAKLDLVAVPAFAPGGMENAGAIFLRDDRMLVDAAHASPATLHAVAMLIAHELAHQWIGDLVTPAAWNDLWLAEATATYVAHQVVAAWHPEWRPWDELQPSIDEVMAADELAAAHPVRTADGDEPLFDAIVYTKGAALLRMLGGWLGDDAVRAALRALVEEHAFANATAEDLWRALDDTAPDAPSRAARAWFQERGHPTVVVGGSCRDGALTLTLRRARAQPASPLPIALRWPGGQRVALLTGDEATLRLDDGGRCPGFVDANAGRVGFYRVRYDAPLAAALALHAERALEPAERVGLLSDAWLDLRDGAPLAGYLSLLATLGGDRSAVVLDEIGRRLAFIDGQLVRSSDEAAFERLVGDLLSPTHAALGWSPRDGDDDDTRVARARVIELLGTLARAPDVVRQSDRLLAGYLADRRSLDPALADAVVALGARNGDDARYDAYLSRLQAAPTPEERERFGEALTHFGRPRLLHRTLSLLLTGLVPADELIRFAAGLADDARGRPTAWRFLKSHFDALERKAPRAGWLLPTTERFCDAEHAREIGRFFALREPYSSLANAIAATTERIASCAALRQRAVAELASWLQARSADGRR
jgi:puromycin-sensitive aminopeptidase